MTQQRASDQAQPPVPTSPLADRRAVRNPWTTVLNQYRSHFRAVAGVSRSPL